MARSVSTSTPMAITINVPTIINDTVTHRKFQVTPQQLAMYADEAERAQRITDKLAALADLWKTPTQPRRICADSAELLIFVYDDLIDHYSITKPMPQRVFNLANDRIEACYWRVAEAALPEWLCLIPHYPMITQQLIHDTYPTWSQAVRDYVLAIVIKYWRWYDVSTLRKLPATWRLAINYQKAYHDDMDAVSMLVRPGAIVHYNDGEDLDYEDGTGEYDPYDRSGIVCASMHYQQWYSKDGIMSASTDTLQCRLLASLPQLPDYLRGCATALPEWLYDAIEHGIESCPGQLSGDDFNTLLLAADIYEWDVTAIPTLATHLTLFTTGARYTEYHQLCEQRSHGNIAAINSLYTARRCGQFWIPRVTYMNLSISNMKTLPPGTLPAGASYETILEIPSLYQLIAAVRYQYPLLRQPL